MTRRHYVDNAPTPTFGPIGTGDTSWTITSATGMPTLFPFTATLDLGTASQENVMVTNIVGTTVTVTRNVDGLGAFSHSSGATFNHTALAVDYDEANAHVNATSGVHGVTGSVVGTTDTQTLSNKTFSGLALSASSGVVGLTITGDNTGDLADFKQASTIVAKVDKDGKITAAALTTAGALASGAATLASAAVTGNETVGGTLGVTGVTTVGVLNSGNHAVTGTLSTTAAATLASASVGGTLGVAGAATLAATSATTLAVSGASALHAVTGTSFTGRIQPPTYANEAARDVGIPSPATGDIVQLTAATTGALGECIEVYSGSAWRRYSADEGTWTAFTPSWTNVTVGNGSNIGWYRLMGKTLDWKITFATGSTSSIPSSNVSVALPASVTSAAFSQYCSAIIGTPAASVLGAVFVPASTASASLYFTLSTTAGINQFNGATAFTVSGTGTNLAIYGSILTA